MKKLFGVSSLLIIVALMVLLSVGFAEAAPLLQDVPGEVEVEVEPEIESEEAAPEEAAPEGAAVRINFEIAGHQAKRGHYSVQVPGGAEVASWYALDGWEDSGWISNLELASDTVWVQVVYYPGPDTEGTVMRILNYVPGEEYGWLSRGKAHALEVAWPDQELVAEVEEN